MNAVRRVDVAIVGARCAGASLAVHLARAGMRVALLDAARLPSDQPLSTHLVQPPGMDELDALGVGARVRELSPALTEARFAVDGCVMRLPYDDGRSGHCLRRVTLDGLLQDAAVAAGAELRPESCVDGLVRAPDGRVCGVEVRRRDGGRERIEAALVVGADGRGSHVARLVGAREYHGYDGPRATYWAYWPRPAGCSPHQFHFCLNGDEARAVFPTDGDLVLVSTAPPHGRAARWRGDHTAAYLADVHACAALEPFLAGGAPVSRVRGIVKTRYFFRAAAGPGWALVGDAGHHKDFVIGFGIADALRDARHLAAAIGEASDAALARYWRRRDLERIAMFRWSQDLGAANEVNAVERLVAARVARTPELARRFGAVIDGRLAPNALFPPSSVARWVAVAALRGDLRPLAPFLATAWRALRVEVETWRCKQRLAAVQEAFRPQPFVAAAARYQSGS